MASVHSLGHSFKDVSQQGVTVATSMDIYTIVARHQLLSAGSVHFLAIQLQLVLRTFSNVQPVVERGHIKLLTLGVLCIAGNSQSYDHQPTNYYPPFQPFLFSTAPLPIPVVAHSW